MTDEIPYDDTRLTIRILLGVVLLIAIAVALVLSFGMHALGFIGLGATVLFFAVMLAFTAGN